MTNAVRPRRNAIGWNFIAAILIGIAWLGYVFIAGMQETDPAIARANRAGIGAVVLSFVEVALLVLYLRRGEIAGLVRVLAGVIGLVGLIQNSVVPLVLRELYEQPFPTTTHALMWYVYGSHLLYALIGDGVRNR